MAEKRKRPRRANGEGTIYQVKSGKRKGTWVGQITIGTSPETGKRKSFYGRTRAEVKAKMDDYKEQTGKGLDVETAKRLTFGEWIVHWLEVYKQASLRLTTYEAYEGHIRHRIVPALGHIYLADLTSSDIQAFYTDLRKEGLAPATIQKMHNIINPCLQKAVDIKPRLLSENPAKETDRPAVKQGKGKAMPEEDMDKFLDTLYQQGDNWVAAFLTLLGTGIRIGELLALEWDDIDFEEEVINVTRSLSRTKKKGLTPGDPKTDESVGQVPIPGSVLRVLKKHRSSQAAWILKQGEKYQNRKLVFPSNKGTYMWPRNFQRKHESLIKKAGIEYVSVHGLRHTFATRMLEQGESLKVVQVLLRHADIKTTGNIYSHVTAKAQKQAAQKMDNLLQKKS